MLIHSNNWWEGSSGGKKGYKVKWVTLLECFSSYHWYVCITCLEWINTQNCTLRATVGILLFF